MAWYSLLVVPLCFSFCFVNHGLGLEVKKNESKNGTEIGSLIKEDPIAEVLEHDTMAFFAVLLMLFLCILVIAFLLNKKFHYLPEALAVMILGCLIAVIIKYVVANLGVNVEKWESIESFHPDLFFLVLLPPIIFESGYTLQKGDFFSNIGAILTYALLGTTVSAIFVGFSMYGLGLVGLAHPLKLIESLSFGSLISATDPVSTLALFSSMNADQDLYAIVFGESVLNDAVSIILTQTLINAAKQMDEGPIDFNSLALHSIGKFCLMFFVSAIIGTAFGLLCAIVLKHVNLRVHSSLEVVTMFIFAYMPYGLSEGLELSGIMAILLCGITMSHYAHFNLSPMGQVAVQQVFRVLALIAETMVFLYLGMAVLNGNHQFEIKFICWSMFACLVARAIVIYPLSIFFVFCRPKQNRISLKILFLVWFSGLRGAVAFAQSLHLPLANTISRNLIMTTTLAIVVFTNIVLGGLTLPIIKFFKVQSKRPKHGISKSLNMGRILMPSEASSQTIKYKARRTKSPMSIIRGWRRFDKKYLMPFFIRPSDSKDYKAAVTDLIDQWAGNEERAANQFLTSSAELDDNQPLVIRRTRKNIVKPVRKAFRALDGTRTEDEFTENESETPAKEPERVRFSSVDEEKESRNFTNNTASNYGTMNSDKESLL